jgi:hypothetical protein
MTKFVRLNKEGRQDFFVDVLKISMLWAIDDERTMIVIDGEYITIDMPVSGALGALSVAR